MKKNSFVEGALISTIGIVLCKIIGLLYVIPFRAIIGNQGAILYGYAYTIYAIFASLSSTGIPSAMAKTISEYNTLEYYNAQERAYKICKYILVGVGVLSFIVLFVFAPQISHAIIGDLEGGNTLADITYVIRVIATALLVIPILSVSRGYVQGHRMMTVPSVSNIIEQLVRVIVIIFGSYFVLNVLHLSITTAVGVSVFGATVGATIAYLYVIRRIKQNRAELMVTEMPKLEEKKITNKIIAKKIILYSLPFVLIELIRSLYNAVDMFTIVKTLVALGFNKMDAENILSIITTWGAKLNQIILAITFGLTMSIIPNIVRSATLKNFEDVSLKMNQALRIIFYTALPLTLGISFLSEDVWTIFYGYDSLSVNIFRVYVLGAFINSFFYILVDTSNALNRPLFALLILIGSFALKAIFNVPMMYLFKFIGINAYYGSIITTILVQLIASAIGLYYLHKQYNVSYYRSLRTFARVIFMNIVMIVMLCLMRSFTGNLPHTRIYSIIDACIYGIAGMAIYAYLTVKMNILPAVFGKDFMDKIFRKFKKAN